MRLMTALLATTAFGTMGANAAITYGSNNAGTLYAGAKLGQVDADLGSSAMAFGVYGGYHYDQNLGAEAEFIVSQDKKFNAGEQTREYGVSSMGVYGTYRYQFVGTPFYAKGRLGIAKTKLEVNNVDGGSYNSVSDTVGLGYGVGAGYQNGNIGVEAGVSKAGDATMFGVGASMTFDF